MLCELTKGDDNSYDLPVVRTLQPLAEIKGLDGLTYPQAIIAQSTRDELKALGIARFDETQIDARYEVVTGQADAWTDDGVLRTFTVGDRDIDLVRADVAYVVDQQRSGRLNNDIEVTIPSGVKVLDASLNASTLSVDTVYVVQRTRQEDRDSLDDARAASMAGLMPCDADGKVVAIGTGTHIGFRMRSNVNVILDATQFLQLISVPCGMYRQDCYSASWVHKAAIAAADMAALKVYDLTTGWPASAPAE